MSYNDDDNDRPNIAETLAKVLPVASILHPLAPEPGDVLRIAVPVNFKLESIDTEPLLQHPRRIAGTYAFADAPSFLAYVQRHADPDSTLAWCAFDPQNFSLMFTAVFDDHGVGGSAAGWRGHRAVYAPAMSAEWKAWKGAHKQPMTQVAFAEWLQEHETDIVSAEGMPTSLQLMTMATEFVANEEHSLKSAVRLQSGGVRLTYVADADKGTTEEMKLYEKFALGLPVFHGGAAWKMVARLKYRQAGGKVSFFYELVRPDRVHQAAAEALIATVREGLAGVPLLFGN